MSNWGRGRGEENGVGWGEGEGEGEVGKMLPVLFAVRGVSWFGVFASPGPSCYAGTGALVGLVWVPAA
jgi:hypothetical protein